MILYPFSMTETDFENYSQEWKELWKSEYVHTIAAFYNTAGGTMTIGRRDDGSIVGVEGPEKVLKSISDTISNKLRIKVDVRLVSIEGKNCIRIDVPKGGAMVDCDGLFYIRVGNTTQTVSGLELKAMLLKENNIQWLDQLSELTIEDLSADALSFFISEGQSAGRIPKDITSDDIAQILEKFNLLIAGRVTLAGALLFSDNPRKLNAGAYLKIGQFDTNESLMRDTYIEGPLIRVPNLATEKLYEAYAPPTNMYDGGGVSVYQKYDYPREAIRELILNAVMHMDYRLNRPVTVAVYPDRLEIFCAGGLPEGMTLELLTRKHTSVLRNTSLASVFYSAGFVESWGQGISKVRSGCILNGNPEPEFQEFCGGILVTIFKTKVTEDVRPDNTTVTTLDDVDREILRQMSENPTVSASSISRQIGLNARTIQRRILTLRDSGIIVREGGDRGGRWRIREGINF